MKKGEKIHYKGTEEDDKANKKPTKFTNYLIHNLFFVLKFLHTEIDNITKEYEGGYDNQEDRFLRYLIDEYNVMLDV